MPTLDNLATRFAHCVSLFRDPTAKAEQKKEVRALLGLLQETTVTLRLAQGGSGIELNGTPCEGAGLAVLVERLDLHGIGELALPANPPPAQLFELLQALADQPGAHDVLSLSSGRRAKRAASRAAPSPPPSPPPAPPPSAPGPPAPAEREAARPPGTRATPTARVAVPPGAADVLAELERNSTSPNVGDLLAALIDHAAAAAKLGRFEQVLGVLSGILRVEEKIPESSGVQRQYGIALRRIYTKPVLEGLSRLLAAPKHRTAAVAALQRGGAAGVEVLMDVLAAAPTAGERRAVVDALKHMTEGTDQLVHMLDHAAWFVVRNVAELIGELGMEDAVPALGKCLDHPDERVRKAVGLALAKIGTRGAAEPLRRALRDRSQEVRMQVAVGIGGRKSSALAMPLVVAMEEEKDEAVVRELILALGRIGSPDAVQALIKWAQPTGRFFGRKPSELRVAAVEALRLAATPAALGTLEGLSEDGDREVRDAASRGVAELKRKPRR